MTSLSDWLHNLGLDRYAQLFADNDVDFEVLRILTEEDLHQLGVSFGHRKRILKAIAEMDPNVRARNQVNTPEDFSRHCFGDARDSFRISAAQFPELKWDATPRNADDGHPVYEIRRYVPGENEIPRADCVWTIDPNQGYLATSVVALKPDGTPWLQYRITATEAAPGVWFPVEFEEKRFGEPADVGRNEVSFLKKIKLTNVRVNEDLPDAQFEIGALRLKEDFPGIVVLRRTLDGKNVPYVYAGDQLVEQNPRRKPSADAPAKSK